MVFDHHHHHIYTSDEYSALDTLKNQHLVMCNGFPLRFCLRASFERSRSLAEVDHRLCSSISWPPKHCMVSTDVWYAQFPVLWPSGGPDIDVTVARALSWVSEPSVVDTWRRLPASSARRPGGCISTVWYYTTYEMLNTRYSGRSDAPEIDCVTVAATPSARSS